jgi:glycosyltransferase involved in cell wall biosynthesis
VKSGGIPEIISHGSNGFLLESRTPRTIQEGMMSFLHNRAVHERAAEEGFRTVQEKFLLSDQLKKIENVLKECLSKS